MRLRSHSTPQAPAAVRIGSAGGSLRGDARGRLSSSPAPVADAPTFEGFSPVHTGLWNTPTIRESVPLLRPAITSSRTWPSPPVLTPERCGGLTAGQPSLPYSGARFGKRASPEKAARGPDCVPVVTLRPASQRAHPD